MVPYRCLYNHDMSGIGCLKSPVLTSFQQDITREHIDCFVKDAEGSQVDVFMCCPTLLRLELWRSEVGGHWQKVAPFQTEPDHAGWNAQEATYYRMRKYILGGGDPVRETYEAVRKTSMAFFFSYRMNDWHYLEMPFPERYPSLDTFYLKHPEYRIGDFSVENPVAWPEKTRKMQNYLIPEVRKHYYDLLEELVKEFDIDGLELDFMRSPCYFPLDQLYKGTYVMSEFVRSIRRMLDQFGLKRGKYLALSVRVPHTLPICRQIGLDVETWDKEKLIDMINVSSSYFHTMELDLGSFREKIQSARLYGEMQAIMHNFINELGWPSELRTSSTIYETTAYHFLHDGADGISFYNFAFTREILQVPVNPASRYAEPPTEVLQHIVDIEYLKKRPKLYFKSNHFCKDNSLPGKNNVKTAMYLQDDPVSGSFSHALFRVVCSLGKNVKTYPVKGYINGTYLKEDTYRGELFSSECTEGEPTVGEVRCFYVPLCILHQGSNSVEIYFEAQEDSVEILRLELALFTIEQPA